MQITAAVVEELHGPFVVRDVELDEPGPGEVTVRVAATGSCHTGGSGRSTQLIGGLMDLDTQGRFPFDRLVEYFPLEEIEEAVEASYGGDVIKPVLRMPH